MIRLSERTEVRGLAAGSRWRGLLWPLGTAVAVAVAGMIPALLFHPYYFVGDTEVGAYGQWYKIGLRLVHWDWSVLNPTVWQSGVYLADGAWGIYSPILWTIGLMALVFNNVIVFVSIVKIAFLVVAALGVFRLARSFGADSQWAAAVAVAAPLAGFTMYQDATTWVTGMIAWSLLPHAWVSLRSVALRGTGVIGAFVWSFFILGITYTHATLVLGLVMLAIIIESFATSRRALGRSLLIGAIVLLAALIAHLPALLTYPDTARQAGVLNDAKFTVSISSLFQSVIPLGAGRIFWHSTHPTNSPLLYMSWMLPLFAMVDWHKVVGLLRSRLSLVGVLIGTLILVQLPGNVGPLRFPVRVLPYLTVVVLVLLALALSRAQPQILGARRLLVALGLLYFSAYLVWASGPKFWMWIVVSTAIITLACIAYYLVMSGRHRTLRQWSLPKARRTLAVSAILLTILLLAMQHVRFPQGNTLHFMMPTQSSTYQSILGGARGDVFVVGTSLDEHHRNVIPSQALYGNSWYATGKRVQNAYTTLQWPAYRDKLCMRLKGETCGKAFTSLFQRQPQTGKQLVDLLGINSVLLIKSSFTDRSWATVPDGWSTVRDTPETRLIARTHLVDNAGGVVWSSPGTQVTVTGHDATRVDFTVTSVPSKGGVVVLSRLPWPGYTVDGGRLSDERAEGFLLTVDVPASATGHVVSVQYRPPGFAVMVGAAGLIGLLSMFWMIGRRFARRDGRFGWILPEGEGIGGATPLRCTGTDS